jgi:pSer/pThr/pTyr-binding forkhead associated (FHA) protein
MAVLTGMSDEVKGRRVPLMEGVVTLGRSADNTVVLDNATVSSHHCKIQREGNRFTLQDLGSTNGTRVNSKEVKEISLKPKDIVQVGSIEFLFDAEEAEVEGADSLADTQVEEEQGPTIVPESFASISPFGARQKDSKGVWTVLIVIIGLLALLGVIVFFVQLVMTS